MADNVASFVPGHLIQTDMAATKNDGDRGGAMARAGAAISGGGGP